ncbi:hypothetical protein HDU96_006659 [Phlyctochytrium bullatum]|nr:hypothetical protein HDU96_006659 [Phlyctochytrium bullatum]
MVIHSLTVEVLLDIALHLHPNDLLVVAATCNPLRLKLAPQTLSFGFAKAHLEVTARRAAGEHSEPWNNRWLYCLEDKAPIRYAHPLLFNYGVAAVALHGFTFTYGIHLGRFMLSAAWRRGLRHCEEIEKRRRMNWVKVLDAAHRMELITLNTLPTLERSNLSNLAYYERRIEVLDAFLLAALGESRVLLRAIFSKYPIETFTDKDDLLFVFRVAAAYRSAEMFSLLLSVLSNESLESMPEPVARTFIEACIEFDFSDPVALLPAGHSALFLPGTSSLTLKAVSQHRPEIVVLLLQKGASPSADLLSEAISSVRRNEPDKKLAIVRHLLAVGADPNALHNHNTALHITARQGASRVMTLLIEAGADVNAAGRDRRKPIHVACRMGYVHLVNRLLEAGADVAAVDERGWTPLHDATRGMSDETIKLVLGAGAPVNAADTRGQTPLHVACQEGSVGLVKLLLEAGANANAVDKKGMTPLHVTCDESSKVCVDILNLLLGAGAEVNAVDVDGRTALHMARARGHVDAFEVLLRAGGAEY